MSLSLSAPARVLRRAVVLAASLVLLVATPAAAVPGGYGVSPGTGTFVPLTTGNLIPAGGANQLVYLSTSATGLRKLPFRLRVYDRYYSTVAVGSNGTVQLGVTSPNGNASPFQKELPTTDVGAAVLPLWGELGYSGSEFGEGVYVRTQGTAPNRTFTISWQGHFIVSAPTEANAQVTFRESSRTITFQYGETTFQTLVTIGIQSREQLAYTEWYSGGKGRYPVNGTRLTLGYVA